MIYSNLGCIAELVGKWLTSIGIDPKLLVDENEVIKKEFVPEPEIGDKKLKKGKSNFEERLSTQEMETSSDSVPKALHEDKDICSVLGICFYCFLFCLLQLKHNFLILLTELLKVLQENFSLSLSSSIILSNYCWEYCLEWNKDPEQVEYFSAAISCSSSIPCPFIKHGMKKSLMTSAFTVFLIVLR